MLVVNPGVAFSIALKGDGSACWKAGLYFKYWSAKWKWQRKAVNIGRDRGSFLSSWPFLRTSPRFLFMTYVERKGMWEEMVEGEVEEGEGSNSDFHLNAAKLRRMRKEEWN